MFWSSKLYSVAFVPRLYSIMRTKTPAIHQSTKRLCSDSTQTLEFAGLSVADTQVQKFIATILEEHTELCRSDIRSREGHRRLASLSPLIDCMARRSTVLANLKQLNEEMQNEKDKDLLQMIEDERKVFSKSVADLDMELMRTIFSMNEEEACSSLIFEVSTGVGGQEAMLFASELYDMYSGYMAYKGWDVDVLQVDNTELGGIRHASAIVTGEDAFNMLKFEAGVHRVQRIPTTERAGRVHTSTVSIAVIPRPDDLDLDLKPKDLKIETKKASGAGGQHVNTTDSAVRIVHLPSGMSVECQTERSQIKNKELAMKKLQAKLCQKYMDEQNSTQSATRKTQVGSSMRNEKIRTYNYNQDRITDHRLSHGGTVHNLIGFLEGGPDLEALIQKLRDSSRRNEIVEMIKNAKGL